MQLPSRHLWELAPVAQVIPWPAYTDGPEPEAGDVSSDYLTAGVSTYGAAQYNWQQLTAKGTTGGTLYGAGSQLGALAVGSGCGGTDIDALRACQEQQTEAFAGAVGAAVGVLGSLVGSPLVGAGLTALWTSVVKAAGIAEAGYGTCDDRTPANQSYVVDPTSDWSSWPYQFFGGRVAFYGGGPKTVPTPGTFEAFADLVIRADFANLHNCAPPCPNHACGQVAPALGPVGALAQAIAAWNLTHSATVPRVGLSAGGLSPVQLPPTRAIERHNIQAKEANGWLYYDGADGFGDAIGFALFETAMLVAQGGTAPPNSLSFVINDGAAIKPLSLANIGAIARAPATATTPAAASSSSSSTGLGTVALVSAAGLAALAVLKPAVFRKLPLVGKLVRR
jgi:hypothetical protein